VYSTIRVLDKVEYSAFECSPC